ncbi:AfsR/SARP family transcriptional regulator [Streptomyces sp. JNUCC 64]
MRFGVLGPLVLWTADGEPVAVPGAKARALLARLLVAPGRAVPAEHLVDDLWDGDSPPEHPRNALQGQVSRLRAALGRAAPDGRELLVGDTAGYRLRIAPEAVDTGRFGELRRRARAAAGDRERVALLSEALGLWRGDAFAGYAERAFARAAAGRLAEERLTALEDRLAARVALGDHADVLGEAEELVAAHPLRERLRATQLRALYRAGRQSEALAGYERLRRLLDEELGLTPGAELVALHGAILRQDPALAGGSGGVVGVGGGGGFQGGGGGGGVQGVGGVGGSVPSGGPEGSVGPVGFGAGAGSGEPVPSGGSVTSGAPAVFGGRRPVVFEGPVRPGDLGGSGGLGGSSGPEGYGVGVADGSGVRGGPPAPVNGTVGRDADVAEVARRLTDARLVTLTGPGGVGKTRLSVEVARYVADAFPDGVWFVELSGVTVPFAASPGREGGADRTGGSDALDGAGGLDGVGAPGRADVPDGAGVLDGAGVPDRVGVLDGANGLIGVSGPTGADAPDVPDAVGGPGGPGGFGGSGDGPVAVVAGALLTALRVPEGGGTGPAPAPPLERLVRAVRERRALLVLDNCEHLVEPVAGVVAELLAGAPALSVLATSREPLGAAGETVRPVAPLPPSDAAALFLARAATPPGFTDDPDNARAVAALCARLDGLPLALEMAAARVRGLGVHGLLARIDDRFALLSGGARTGPARQRTLRAVIDWSWELLAPAERTVLRRLSAFAGGCSPESAEEVCAGDGIAPGEVLDLLARLVDRSLVVLADHPDGPVYRLLESVRAYAAERLAEAAETDAVRERHSRHHADLAVRAAAGLRGPGQRRWLERLDGAGPDLRLAVEHAVRVGAVERALRTVNSLAWYGVVRGRPAEAGRALDAVLGAGAGAGGTDAEAGPGTGAGGTEAGISGGDGSGAGHGALGGYGVVGGGREDGYGTGVGYGVRGGHGGGDVAGAGAGYARERARAVVWRTGLALMSGAGTGTGSKSGSGSGSGADGAGGIAAALVPYESGAVDDPAGYADALWFLGSAQVGAGDVETGEALVNQALDRFAARGDDWGTAAALSVRTRHAMARGDLAAVRRDGERGAGLFRALGDPWGRLQTVFPLAALAAINGEYAEANRLHREGLEIAERLGLPGEAAKRHTGLGRLALLAGDDEGARTHHERALRLAREAGLRSGEADARLGLALGARRAGRYGEAEGHLRALLAWFREVGYGPGEALVLVESGFVAEARGDAEGAWALHLEGLRVARGLGDVRAVALALEGLAGASVAAGEPERAAVLIGAAGAARESVAAPLPPAERGDVDRVSSAAREALGSPAYARAFARGVRLPPSGPWPGVE